MDENLKYFGPRELAAIFDFLSAQLSEVIWICTNDYKKQLYTSPLFENAWGFSRDILYESREIWPTTLFEEDLKRITNDFQQRQIKENSSVIAFRVRKPDGGVEFIKDTSFGVCDKNGNQVAQLGTAKILTASEWDMLAENKFQEKAVSKLNMDVKNILADNLKLDIPSQSITPLNQFKNKYFVFINDKPIRLTPAEAKCFYYLMQSYSAKQIARSLSLSNRTIESCIENIKLKANCKRSIELLNKTQNRSQIEQWAW